MSDRCSLYWIKSKTHTDMFTEGYIGISHDPHNRLRQHIGFARVKQNHHRQNSEFKKILKDGSFEQKVLLVGTPEYCLGVEKKLRPNKNIGWNLAIGGDGGYAYKHGLTGTRVKGDFYNMLTRASKSGATVCDDWVGEGALQRFREFRKDKIGQMFVPKEGVVSPETLLFLPRSVILRRAHPVEFEGVTTSISELAERFQIKRNTITCRLRRGWTLKESIYGK